MNFNTRSQHDSGILLDINGNSISIGKFRKRFPPFGKQLNDLRQKGMVPAMRVVVTTDWKLGGAYPRIVMPSGTDVSLLNFDYLAGLNVQIVHHANEAELVSTLTDAILAVKPKTLVLFNFDQAKQKDREFSAISVIHPKNWRPV
jgi:hypothetical protein